MKTRNLLIENEIGKINSNFMWNKNEIRSNKLIWRKVYGIINEIEMELTLENGIKKNTEIKWNVEIVDQKCMWYRNGIKSEISFQSQYRFL